LGVAGTRATSPVLRRGPLQPGEDPHLPVVREGGEDLRRALPEVAPHHRAEPAAENGPQLRMAAGRVERAVEGRAEVEERGEECLQLLAGPGGAEEERTEGDAVEHPLAIHPPHWLARTRAVAARTPGEGERLHRASRCTPRLAGHHQDPAGL